MRTIKTEGYNVIRIRDCQSCGDIFMDTETIDNVQYNIYLGFCGYCTYYAVKA